MTDLDYASITATDLDLVREPRKSRFTVVHKPTNTVGETPVIPTAHAPARFRRPTTVPKENRVPNMEGYIEAQSDDAEGFYPIIGGGDPKNEYLEALVTDQVALRMTFEGLPDSAPADAEKQPVPSIEEPEPVAETPPTPPSEPPTAPPQPGPDPSTPPPTPDTAPPPTPEPSAEELTAEADQPDESAIPGNDESPPEESESSKEIDDLLAGLET